MGSLPGARGNADGAEGIFGKLRARVGYGPAPGPTQKRPCTIHARKVGRASNTAVSQYCTYSIVALRSAVFTAAQIRPGTFWQLDNFFRPQGAFPPRLLLPLGRLGSSPGAWSTPNKGNADGAVGSFGKRRARVGYGPAPGTTKKGLVPHLPVRWGKQQIPQYRNTAPIQLSGRTSVGCVYCGTDPARYVLAVG